MSAESSLQPLPAHDLTSITDSHTPVETLRLAELIGIAKAHLSWIDLIIKSFVAGIFLSLGAGFDIAIAGGAPGLRQSNPSMATLLSALVFPVGLVFITLTNMELATSRFSAMPCAALQRRIFAPFDC
ncbi:Formate/nitrite transporter-domain-containing protein [Ampelomyces quisqualis]|uniref:Formate/nitrite transporter-domain-containing protein n=1 Tax=Ampelomyces quisqualis TaxID=50730 RepID=A0A6A5QN52_AMPQU|nr:Formate/nitrite transporter-domain-containing protein [Ampelomyces quisqualis]